MTNIDYTKGNTIVGVFDRTDKAEKAINDLRNVGFQSNSISVVTKDRNDQKELVEASGNNAAEGTLVGSLSGGTLGAVLGWLLAGGTALIPGIGPVAAAGIFGATVGGALIGGSVGGIGGALAGQGVPEADATEYEGHVKEGRTLVTVSATSDTLLKEANRIFEDNNASNVRMYGGSLPNDTGVAPTDATRDSVMTNYQGGDYEVKPDANRPVRDDNYAKDSNNGRPVATGGEFPAPMNYGNTTKRDQL